MCINGMADHDILSLVTFLDRMGENSAGFQSMLKYDVSPETVEESLVPILCEKEMSAKSSKETLEKYKRERSTYDIRIDSIRAQLQKHKETLERKFP